MGSLTGSSADLHVSASSSHTCPKSLFKYIMNAIYYLFLLRFSLQRIFCLIELLLVEFQPLFTFFLLVITDPGSSWAFRGSVSDSDNYILIILFFFKLKVV